MRVIASGSQITSPCDTPNNGQVEDYGLFFGTAQILGCTDPNSSTYNPSATIDDGSCEFTNNEVFTWYEDADNDGYGNEDVSMLSENQPNGYVSNDLDCNDENENVRPNATEICDGLDNNCDGQIDEGLEVSTYYIDNDGDGYGNDNAAIERCSAIAGYVLFGGDCDDNNASINPNAQELCDGLDNNCDGMTDNGAQLVLQFRDRDEDGFGNEAEAIEECELLNGYVLNFNDCDDNNASINPDAQELCDGLDNNCDGMTDNGAQLVLQFRDRDEDGFGNEAEAIEECELLNGYVLNFNDCDDNNANINPEASELCDGLDNNCDFMVDNDVQLVLQFRDRDEDGFGNEAEPLEECELLDGYVLNSNDCDDNNANINPEASELCDGLDNNCDFIVDNDVQLVLQFRDRDEDGFGNEAEPIEECELQDGYAVSYTHLTLPTIYSV